MCWKWIFANKRQNFPEDGDQPFLKFSLNDSGMDPRQHLFSQSNKKLNITVQDFELLKTIGLGSNGEIYLASFLRDKNS